MRGVERDAPILHERRCERRLMRRTSRAEAYEWICRPSVVRIEATRRLAAPNLNRARAVCAACVEWFGPLSKRPTQPTVPASGGFCAGAVRAPARSKLHVTLKARGGVAIRRHRKDMFRPVSGRVSSRADKPCQDKANRDWETVSRWWVSVPSTAPCQLASRVQPDRSFGYSKAPRATVASAFLMHRSFRALLDPIRASGQ
jgi:hypothetical protein